MANSPLLNHVKTSWLVGVALMGVAKISHDWMLELDHTIVFDA